MGLHLRPGDQLAERYIVQRELGRGAMGIVFLASDLRYGRKVAVKVLNPDLSSSMAAERFKQEISILARLAHPHIVPLLDSGWSDAVCFYVMPNVEGESLAARLSREGPLSLNVALGITRDVADALEHAHGCAVIHRDIKPENILLTTRHAVITDFGVASAIEAAADRKLTLQGSIVGTHAYMSPEQALGDGQVDQRSDIYSLACVLYEMLTGQPPYAAPDPRALLAEKLLNDPPALPELSDRTPAALRELIRTALDKEPLRRPASASHFIEAIDSAVAELSGASPARFGPRRRTSPSGMAPDGGPLEASKPELRSAQHHPVLGDAAAAPELTPSTGSVASSKHRARRAHFARVGRAALVVLAGGLIITRADSGGNGAAQSASLIGTGALNRGERVLVAGLQYAGGDTLLGLALTEALRIGLEQSLAVGVVSTARVRSVLLRMDRAGESPLNPELAREVALREGVRVLLTGEILRAAGSWIISVRLTDPASGDSYMSLSEDARDSTALLRAIGRLSKRLGERVGESRGTIRSSERLEAVTTPSLEALRKYTQAEQALHVDQDLPLAIHLLQDAVALDSAFAMAWRKLAVAYLNSGYGRDKIVAAFTRAYQHRERLTDRERYFTVGSYHFNVTEDWERAAAAYRALLATYPEESEAHNMLAIAYSRLHQYERSAEEYALAIAADSNFANAYVNLARALQRLGRWNDATGTIDRYEARFGGRAEAVRERFFIATSRGDFATAERVLGREGALRNLDIAARAAFAHYRADLANVRGRLTAAERHRAEAVALDIERGNSSAAVLAAVWNGMIDMQVRRNARRAVARVDAALRGQRLAELGPLDRPYLALAEFYARAAQATRARQLMAEYERDVPMDQRGNTTADFTRVRGFILLSEGGVVDGIRELQAAHAASYCRICGLSDIARAWDVAGQPDSAIALYERYLATPWDRRIGWDASELGAAYERLSQLYDTKGDHERAVLYAAKLVTLWLDADPELQPRVQAARRRVEQLGGRSSAQVAPRPRSAGSPARTRWAARGSK